MTTLSNGNVYYLNLNDSYGNRVGVIPDFLSLDYTRSVNNVGQLQLKLPVSYALVLQPYYQLEVWRSAGNGVFGPYLDMEALWIILSIKIALDDTGLYLEAVAQDINMVLASRIVAYYANSSQTSKTGLAGDKIKEIVSENVSSTASDYSGSTTRGLNASLYSIQANLGDGASVSMSFSWRQVLAVLQDLANASAAAGSYIAFDTVSDGLGHSEFRTYANQRGNDHRLTGNNPIILDPYAGNLANTSLTYDYTSEATFVYAAGQGTDAARTMATSSDATRLAVSPFARRELFQDARQATNVTQVQNAATAALRSGRGKVIFDSKVIETPSTRYGIEYRFGDILPCQILGQLVDCRLEKVHVSVTGAIETIDVGLQSVT